MAGPGYDRHVKALRGALEQRSEALLRGLRTTGLVRADAPAGGFYIWCRADGPRELLAALQDDGVAVADGERFLLGSATAVDGAVRFRAAFCGHDATVLESAGRSIAAVVERAAAAVRQA